MDVSRSKYSGNLKLCFILQTDEEALKKYRDVMKKPMKNVWISENPLNCECENYLFIDYLLEFTKTKVRFQFKMISRSEVIFNFIEQNKAYVHFIVPDCRHEPCAVSSLGKRSLLHEIHNSHLAYDHRYITIHNYFDSVLHLQEAN